MTLNENLIYYNMASGNMGLVGIWDGVAFYEVAHLQKMPKKVGTTFNSYCESGTFARGNVDKVMSDLQSGE